MKFDKNTLGIVQCYAPTTTYTDADVLKFYNDVSTAIENLKKCTWLIVMGDMNAKIGVPSANETDVIGEYGIGIRNDRGSMLINFARSHQLFVANTIFKKRKERQWTWSLGRAKNEIDYIMIRNNQKHLVKDVDVVNGFKFNSDHRMVRMTIDLKVRRLRSFKKYIPKINVQFDDNLIEKFNENLQKNLKNISEYQLHSTQEQYDQFCSDILTCAEPFRSKKQTDFVLSTVTKQEIETRETLKRKRNENERRENEFKIQRKKVNRLIKRDVYRHEISQLQDAIENGKSLRNARNGITNSKTWIPQLIDKNGTVRTNREEVLEVAAKFYENLYKSTLSEEERNELNPDLNDNTEIDEKIKSNRIR